MSKTLLIVIGAICAATCGGVAVFAQEPPPPSPPPHVFFKSSPPGMSPIGRDLFFFMGTHRYLGKVVTGVPYSAQTVTDTVQPLVDGNRIERKESGSVYRDAEGRTRFERTLGMIGPWAPAGKPIENIFIDDPVAHVTYVLNPTAKRAYKSFEVRSHPLRGSPPRAHGPTAANRVRRTHFPSSTESLGTRTIDGLKAEGERRTVTIPAGEIGNEKPIKIVSESWYSPQLKVYVLTRRNDPRFGITTYRLTDIKLGPPPESLFQVPSDYAIENSHPRRRFRPGQPAQQPGGSGH